MLTILYQKTTIFYHLAFLQYRRQRQPDTWEQIFEYIFESEIFWFFFIPLLLLIFFKLVAKEAHSNWNHLLDNFEFSSEEFYKRLKQNLHSHGIKEIDTYIVYLKQGGIFSKRRKYLRVNWKGFQYDICAAPFGKGFFVSWWLLYNHSVLKIIASRIPFIGNWLVRKWFPITYYKVDSASMFMTYCHQSVLQVIDDITNDKGVKALTEDEKKPLLNNIFKR